MTGAEAHRDGRLAKKTSGLRTGVGLGVHRSHHITMRVSRASFLLSGPRS